ncbi:PID-CTERM protein-sorting domain-containing protein [Flavobacterium piscinae]|uniref:PID-CTERM protein-sorting domain-containing protein n=1 Tax=Flavobacterium piscinae TaxID=2506424 RepID=UPI003709A541
MVSLTAHASTLVANPNPPPPTPPPPGLPIDGGIVLLLLIGLVFAFYKFNYKHHIKKNAEIIQRFFFLLIFLARLTSKHISQLHQILN